jgi:hypothetical protein
MSMATVRRRSAERILRIKRRITSANDVGFAMCIPPFAAGRLTHIKVLYIIITDNGKKINPLGKKFAAFLQIRYNFPPFGGATYPPNALFRRRLLKSA